MILENVITDSIIKHIGHDITVMPTTTGLDVYCRDCGDIVARHLFSQGCAITSLAVFYNLSSEDWQQIIAHENCNLSLSQCPEDELVLACEDHHEVMIEWRNHVL